MVENQRQVYNSVLVQNTSYKIQVTVYPAGQVSVETVTVQFL